MGRCALGERVVRVDGLDGYIGEQVLPVGIQECLERFYRGCVDYLSRQFVPKWDSPNCEGELATVRTASLLVELECEDEGGRHGEFQETVEYHLVLGENPQPCLDPPKSEWHDGLRY